MRCEFSEFSYGYACMREAEATLNAVFPPLRAPVQPSLLTENRVGYDAAFFQVDYTLFLQFKRSEHITRRHTSTCVADGEHDMRCSWMHWPTPHFRFDIDTSSNQYAAMSKYAAEVATGAMKGDSYYVAPMFIRERALDWHYFGGTVLENSMLIDPQVVPNDGGEHRVSAVPGAPKLLVMSEPRFLDGRESWSVHRDRIASEDLSDRHRRGEPLTLAGLTELLEVWSMPHPERQVEQVDLPMVRLRDAARRLGGEIFVVGHRDDGPEESTTRW